MAQIVINEISQNYTYNIGTHSYATVALPITSCWGPGYFDAGKYYANSDDFWCNQNDGTDKKLGSFDGIGYMLDHTAWERFPATQEGLERFVATYRGPASPYRLAKDFSYQMAVTLITSGHDVLVCRMCPGDHAAGSLIQPARVDATSGDVIKPAVRIDFRAKYPGSFGNNLRLAIKKMSYFDKSAGADAKYRRYYWNVVTYVVDASGVQTSVENKSFTADINAASDSMLYWREIDSNFWDILRIVDEDGNDAILDESEEALTPTNTGHLAVILQPNGRYAPNPGVTYSVQLGMSAEDPTKTAGYVASPVHTFDLAALAATGTDIDNNLDNAKDFIHDIAEARYIRANAYTLDGITGYELYPETIKQFMDDRNYDDTMLKIFKYREWLYTHAYGFNDNIGGVYDLLKDKLAYSPNRVISPGWDDQDYLFWVDDDVSEIYGNDPTDPGQARKAPFTRCADTCEMPISPLHVKLMDVAYHSRCATGYIDIPRTLDRRYVHIEDEMDANLEGYAQKLARIVPRNESLDTNGVLFHTNSALFVPWGQYIYLGTGKMNIASPSFIALMIQRAQILNQPTQYEWALPTNRKHNLKIGKLDYIVPKKLLDKWQKLDGVGVNVITTIPDLGTNIWGNSTLFEVPPVTYQALANLSTRWLVNAVEDIAYKCGISITFQYNNNQAYNKFYAGVTPLLDTMKNVGAIEDYYVKMAADINGLDHVNANTVVGKIYLVVNGVINDIIVDLICLPPSADLDEYRN